MAKLIIGENDLLTLYPLLCKEWDYEANEDLNPQTVLPRSDVSVWWKCKLGHKWQSQIKNRTLGGQCPYCSGRRILTGYNDLETWCRNNNRTDLLVEWSEKNDILPNQISPHNNKKILWNCKLGHEWEASLGSRTGKKPSGCPYCSIPVKKILVGFNDFETKCRIEGKENLLKEWNVERNIDIFPQSISYCSGIKVWWKCDKGHEWKTAPVDRVNGTGCPICSRTSTSFPEQAITYYLADYFTILQRYKLKRYELDVYLEDYNIGIEYDGIIYHSSAKAKERELQKDAFFKENGIKVIHLKETEKENSIEGNTIKFIVRKKNYLDESFNNALILLIHFISSETNVPMEIDVDVIRDELKIRELYASYLKKHSVASVYPELISEWDTDKNQGMTPDTFSANAHTKVWWKCKNGHNWQASISSRNRKLGCPYCAGQRTIIGKNDFESWCKENNPGLLIEWNNEKNNINPSEMMKTSNKKFWWKCANGHEWEATIANRVHGTKCPYCYTGNASKRKLVSFKEWCIKNNKEYLLAEWDYDANTNVKPNTISKGSHKKVWWKCKFGHSWEAQLKSRTYDHGCPYCSKTYKKVVIGENDLVTWCKINGKEYIVDEWDYNNNENLTPDMFTFGSHKRINWICSKGHKWNAVIKERTKYRGNMCPECRNE